LDEGERGQRIFLAIRSCAEIPRLQLGVVERGSEITTMTKWAGPSDALVGFAMVIVYLPSTFKAVCNDDGGQTSECGSVGGQDRQRLLDSTTSASATRLVADVDLRPTK